MKRAHVYTGGAAALAGIVVALVAVVMLLTGGGENHDPTAAAADEQAPAGASESNANDASDGGTNEGIDVHGHWTIEVRNADGSVAERREFENALTSSGELFLALILAREGFTANGWGIMLFNTTPDAGPCDSVDDGVEQDCLILEDPAPPPFATWPDTVQYNTLEISRTGVTSDTLTLIGTANATDDGTITWVGTTLCLGSSPDPATCNNAQFFTQKSLPAPVALSTGQQIYVRVDITFS